MLVLTLKFSKIVRDEPHSTNRAVTNVSEGAHSATPSQRNSDAAPALSSPGGAEAADLLGSKFPRLRGATTGSGDK